VQRNGFRDETLHFLPLVTGIHEIVRTPSGRRRRDDEDSGA
jgi:hypothetical protein